MVILAAAALAGYFTIAFLGTPALKFEDRHYPPGFRDLVLTRGVTPPDPMIGFGQAARTELPARPGVSDICERLYRDPLAPAVGDPTGAVQIAAFLDYRCPYCKTLSKIMSGLPGNTRVVFHEWAILGEPSVLAARAALASARQGKYDAMHARLMNARLIPTPAYIDTIAGELGLDLPRLHADMGSEDTTRALQRASELAKWLGLAGTPVLVIGRTVAAGEISGRQLDRLIADEARSGTPRVC